MIKKGILILSLIIISLFFLFVISLRNSSVNISAYSVKEVEESDVVDIDDIQFFKNMRFPRKILSYRIDPSCNDFRKNRIKSAFDILKNETVVINFVETLTDEDIFIDCEGYHKNISEEYIQVGEGGVYSVINAGKFYVIRKGKIYLYESSVICDTPNVEIHELLHVFGFKHSNDNKSIMYNISFCNQDITENITNKLISLYTIPEVPDLVFENLSYDKGFYYTDFSVDVANKGLREAENVTIWIDYGNPKILVTLGDFDIGEKKTISVKNFRVNRNKKIELNIETINDLDESDNTISF